MRIITEPASGDFQISVEDMSETAGNLTGYNQPQLGIVIRQSAAAGAPFYTALQDPTYPAEGENVANVIMYYRDTWGGPVVELTQNYPLAFPRYLMVQRHGDTFQTLFSTNGTNYTLISATVHTIVMPTTLLAGMGVASGRRTATTTAVVPESGDRATDTDLRRAERAARMPDDAGPARTSAPAHRSATRRWSTASGRSPAAARASTSLATD